MELTLAGLGLFIGGFFMVGWNMENPNAALVALLLGFGLYTAGLSEMTEEELKGANQDSVVCQVDTTNMEGGASWTSSRNK